MSSDLESKIRFDLESTLIDKNRELKNQLMEESKERARLEQMNKAVSAESNEVKAKMSQLKTETQNATLSLQNKINELLAKVESQQKEMGVLEVQDRKSKKTITELKKQVADLADIKKRAQVQQTEIADKLDTENKGDIIIKLELMFTERNTMMMEIKKYKDENKDIRLKLETETNAKNKAEMDLDNVTRRLGSQEADFKNKTLSLVKENTALNEGKKKLEATVAQVQKKYSEVELLNRTLSVRLKELEKKISTVYRANTVPKTNSKAKLKREKKKPDSETDGLDDGVVSPDTVKSQLEFYDDADPEEYTVTGTLEAENQDVLLIGNEKFMDRLLTFLNQKRYKALLVDAPEAHDLLTKKRFGIVMCSAKILPELLSTNGTNFLEIFKRNNQSVPFITLGLGEGIDGIVKQLNNVSLDPLSFQELIKVQATAFLQSLWTADNIKQAQENFDKEKEILQLSRNDTAILKMEEELKQLESTKKKVEHENQELNKIIRKFVTEKQQKDAELDQLKKKVSALCSKIFMLELEKDSSLALPPPAAPSVSKVDADSTAEKAITAFESPVQQLSRIAVGMLKDERCQDIRPYVQAILAAAAANNLFSPDFQGMFQETGLDALTQSWMIYEFTKGRNVGSSKSRRNAISENTAEVLPEVDKSIVESWGCDPRKFSVDELHSLYIHMLDKLGLIDYFNIPVKNLANFCRAIARNYRNNPYHNFYHAFDVAQMCFKMVYKTKAMEYLTELDLLALLVSSLCHDVDHPGLNNNFQINDNTHLAMLYNDISVLENHHASRTFYILNTPENNIFVNMDESTYRDIRRVIITAVLATDMANHFELMTKFTTHIATKPFSNKNADSRQLMINVLLHIADISNVSRPWELSKQWSDLVLDEFLHQGDLEKEKDLLISPYMDRNNTDQPKMSLGFIDYMVNPMFTSLKKTIPEVTEACEQIHKNRATWVQRSESEISVEQVLEEYQRSGTPLETTSRNSSAPGTPRSVDMLLPGKQSSQGRRNNSSPASLNHPPRPPILVQNAKTTLKHSSTLEFEPKKIKTTTKKPKSQLPSLTKDK